MRNLPMQLIVAVALVVVEFPAHAQAGAAAGSACRPADSTSTWMVTWLKDVVTRTDGASVSQRTHMKLPQVAASQITYVTDKNVCSKVLNPYNANSTILRSGTPVAPSGKLYVVEVGTVYVANDPVKKWGEFTIYVTLDSRFRLLARSL